MIDWLTGWFKPKRCAVCGRKPQQSSKYYNDQGTPVVVCQGCVEYAERRAFRRRT